MRPEPLNTSIPLHHVQSGAGMLRHTGGTYSHNGMIDYTRFPISELHLGQFPDSMEFQCWNVNFKTEVCSKTADHHLTMHWIKEVETAKSIDELMTSRSIAGRRDFSDFHMLDAIIASALKRLLHKQMHFRKGVRVEEQRAQKYDRFSRGRQIARMIYEHVRATGAYVMRTLRLVQYTFTERRCPRFRRSVGSSSIISKRYAFRCDPGRIVQVKITGLFSFRLSWLSTIKKPFEIMGRQVIYD